MACNSMAEWETVNFLVAGSSPATPAKMVQYAYGNWRNELWEYE